MRLYLSPTRYYSVAIQLDLFGEPVIVRAWGGRGNRLGGTATEPFSRKRLREIAKERRRHGYSLAGHA
ncbi:hypothetical protein LH427_03720 [Laribacter hongkongensis]|uniref:hypothetical protein n=1 Tax=Laribacter hongkongensis TaxID=168471 RepID=UPI001EFDC2CB|nr:hypothetical protein [Laribacter hongkongensis]MCG8990897.1 hypothetical protein [Laribacter hongkongensis]MCG8997035.1 hypothetical protein [Laribacter hongkongensis]MCG9003526.1 hypothetical protein [Laribacter hongkongensis]MCG9012738.1 hypothetical protein [Laribacter hongkongensis]MCG9019311.1 hypothetical protein [Laribacter hongkongensis]